MKEERHRLMRYGHLIILLRRLVKAKAITEDEAEKIKQRIMKEYRIISEFTA